MVRPPLFEKLASPCCRTKLSVTSTAAACNTCGKGFAISDGLIQFSPHSDFYEDFSTLSATLPSPFKRLLLKIARLDFLREVHFWEANVPAGTGLDLGCGGGKQLFRELIGPHIVGVDLSSTAVRQARKLYPYTYQCDIFALPFESESFDVVVSSHVLGHVPYPQKIQVIGEISRVLKDHGTFVGIVETDSLHPWIVQIKRSHPEFFQERFRQRRRHIGVSLPSETLAEFKTNGFDILKVKKMDASILRPWFYYLDADTARHHKGFAKLYSFRLWIGRTKTINRLFSSLWGYYDWLIEPIVGKLDNANFIGIVARKSCT